MPTKTALYKARHLVSCFVSLSSQALVKTTGKTKSAKCLCLLPVVWSSKQRSWSWSWSCYFSLGLALGLHSYRDHTLNRQNANLPKTVLVAAPMCRVISFTSSKNQTRLDILFNRAPKWLSTVQLHDPAVVLVLRIWSCLHHWHGWIAVEWESNCRRSRIVVSCNQRCWGFLSAVTMSVSVSGCRQMYIAAVFMSREGRCDGAAERDMCSWWRVWWRQRSLWWWPVSLSTSLLRRFQRLQSVALIFYTDCYIFCDLKKSEPIFIILARCMPRGKHLAIFVETG